MLMRTVPFLVFFVVLVLLPTGCAGAPPDFPNLAAAFKFVGCCSVICSLVWAYAIIRGSNNHKGGN